jgi:hypothetical protein
MPPGKKAAPAATKTAAPAKAAVQATITLKHVAAVLSDSHDLSFIMSLGRLSDCQVLGDGAARGSDGHAFHPTLSTRCRSAGTQPRL